MNNFLTLKNENYIFIIDSISKFFTIFTILILNEKKIIDLSDKLNKY